MFDDIVTKMQSRFAFVLLYHQNCNVVIDTSVTILSVMQNAMYTFIRIVCETNNMWNGNFARLTT